VARRGKLGADGDVNRLVLPARKRPERVDVRPGVAEVDDQRVVVGERLDGVALVVIDVRADLDRLLVHDHLQVVIVDDTLHRRDDEAGLVRACPPVMDRQRRPLVLDETPPDWLQFPLQLLAHALQQRPVLLDFGVHPLVIGVPEFEPVVAGVSDALDADAGADVLECPTADDDDVDVRGAG